MYELITFAIWEMLQLIEDESERITPTYTNQSWGISWGLTNRNPWDILRILREYNYLSKNMFFWGMFENDVCVCMMCVCVRSRKWAKGEDE
jgi:hypothetical protein